MIELMQLAFRNIRKRRKRTFLTMLGIFIGIAAVVALISLGQGFEKTINDQFEKVGADKIVIQAKQMGYGDTSVPGRITIADKDLISKAQGVAQAAGQLMPSGTVQYNNIQRTRLVLTIPDDAKEVELVDEFSTWEAEEGRLLTHKDKGKAAVGYNVAKKNVFEKDIRVGSTILVNGERFEVIGIIKRTGDPGTDNSILMPEKDARAMTNDTDGYGYLVAKTAKGADPDTVAERIERLMRKDRHLKEGEENFTVDTATELIESFMKVLAIVQAVFVGIALISLLVGGIGIMNTMFTAVLERTKEIAVMKAIGAQNKDIMQIFLFESGMLGLAGGIIGILLGIGISSGVSAVTNAAFGPNTLNAYYAPMMIIGMLVFSTTIGMISGYLPARRASKLQPADSLRYE